MNRINLLKIIFIFICWQSIASAAISVQVNPSTVRVGEIFRLIFTMDTLPANATPDLTPLQENFTIVGTERSTAYSIINGQAHSILQWIVLLTAKKSGRLTIPSIQIGRQQSAPSSINSIGSDAIPSPDSQSTNQQDDVMIKAEVNEQAPLINQQVVYTVRLYNSQRLMDAEYVPPRVDNAILVPLGDGRRYEKALDGRNYIIEEQQYVIFPQKSGMLKIISPTFNALVFDTIPKKISVHDKPIKLTVKPIPANYSGKDWLPARHVALTEVYDQTDKEIKEGSTLVRTVTLQAAGFPAQLLPNLKFSSTSQFNAYSEKPVLRNIASHQELTGRADIKITYVFDKPGKVTIPAFNLTWFNTETGKEERASLPLRIINIEATKNPAVQQARNKPNDLSSSITPISLSLREGSEHLAWWIAGGFALAWVITLGLWMLVSKTSVGKKRKMREILHSIETGCKNNNPKETQEALLRFARLRWPGEDILNLHKMGVLTQDPLLKQELSRLSQALYDQGGKKWQGETLWYSLTTYLKIKPKRRSKNTSQELPPMYPR